MTLGTPVIVTPCDAFKEIGIKNGVNGFVLDFNMENIDVNKIYESKIDFMYKTPADNWCNLLEKGKSTYKEELEMVHRVKATEMYRKYQLIDSQLGFVPAEGYEFEVSDERFRVLNGDNSYGCAFVTEVKGEKPKAVENKVEENKPEETPANKKAPVKETAVKKVPNKKKAVK